MRYVYGSRLAGISHLKNNKPCQDNFYIAKNQYALFAAVCDGVGSEKHSDMASEIASSTAVKYCEKHIKSSMDDEDVLAEIYHSFEAAYAAVEIEAIKRKFDLWQCDTTMTLAILFENGDLFYGHVGDSGLFALFDDGTIKPVTTQQNDFEGRVYPLRDKSSWVYDKAEGKIASAMLCTDGVWSMLHPKRSINAEIKYSIPLVDYYVDHRYIPIRISGKVGEEESQQALEKWLDNNLLFLNKEKSFDVRQDDITIVIMQDTDISVSYQSEEYYIIPETEVEPLGIKPEKEPDTPKENEFKNSEMDELKEETTEEDKKNILSFNQLFLDLFTSLSKAPKFM